MWLQWPQRPQTSSVVERWRGGRKLCGTEALALALGYIRSSWDHLVCIRIHSFSLCDTLKSFDRFNVHALFMLQAIYNGYMNNVLYVRTSIRPYIRK